MSEWKEVRLEDVADNFAMGPFGSNIKAENFVTSGIPVIKGTNMNSDKYVCGPFSFLTEHKAKELHSSICYPGDLVFTHRGTIGQVCLIPEGYYSYYVISQSGMKCSTKIDILDNNFLFYFFKTSIGQHELLKNASQVGVPAISSPLSSLKSIRIKLPDIFTQRHIANVLSSIDNKIELNNRINGNLVA